MNQISISLTVRVSLFFFTPGFWVEPPTEDLRKYELGTVIRALFVLARALSAPDISQEPSDGSALPVEQIMGDESLMFSQEEPDDSAS